MKILPSILAVGLIVLFALPAVATHNSPQELESRVAAVGQFKVSDTVSVAESGGDGPKDGRTVYDASCAVCHAAGVGGAPVTGQPAAWSERIAQGLETLFEHAINGFQGAVGVMPAKGGNPALSDAEVTAAVQYMVDQVQ